MCAPAARSLLASAAAAAPLLVLAVAGSPPATVRADDGDDEGKKSPVREAFRAELEVERRVAATSLHVATVGARTVVGHAKALYVLDRATGKQERKIDAPNDGLIEALTPVGKSHVAVQTLVGLFVADLESGAVTWKTAPISTHRMTGPAASGWTTHLQEAWAAKDEKTLVRVDDEGEAREISVVPMDRAVAKAQGERRNKYRLRTSIIAGPISSRRHVWAPIHGRTCSRSTRRAS